MPARSKPLPCEAGIQVKREQDTIRDVAQPGRVRVWGACGRKFESCHPDC